MFKVIDLCACGYSQDDLTWWKLWIEKIKVNIEVVYLWWWQHLILNDIEWSQVFAEDSLSGPSPQDGWWSYPYESSYPLEYILEDQVTTMVKWH